MRKVFFSVVCLLCTSLLQSCDHDNSADSSNDGKDTQNWCVNADKSTNALLSDFWDTDEHVFRYYSNQSGFETQWHYWPQAHAMDVVIDAYQRTKNEKYKQYFEKWYDGIYHKNGDTYINHFYDDMEWICLTMIRLHELTQEERYLKSAQLLWNDIKTGWSSEIDGGIYWTKDRQSKNACSNAPAGIIAARMYVLEGKPEDLDWAKKIFDWETVKLVTPLGRVNDNIDKNGKVVDMNFTYNQGVYLGMAHELYKITKESRYLRAAVKASDWTINHLVDIQTNVLKSEGCGDGGLFKGIFVRYFVKLILDKNLDKAHKLKYTRFLVNNSNTLWENGVHADNVCFGPDWCKPGNLYDKQGNDLPTQVS